MTVTSSESVKCFVNKTHLNGPRNPRWIHSEKDLNVLTRISLFDFSKVFEKEFDY